MESNQHGTLKGHDVDRGDWKAAAAATLHCLTGCAIG